MLVRSDCAYLLPRLPCDLSFTSLFGKLHLSLDQAIRLRNHLNYFDVLDAEEPWGHLHLSRVIHKGGEEGGGERNGFVLDPDSEWTKPLTPIYLTHERRGIDLHSNSHIVTLGET